MLFLLLLTILIKLRVLEVGHLFRRLGQALAMDSSGRKFPRTLNTAAGSHDRVYAARSHVVPLPRLLDRSASTSPSYSCHPPTLSIGQLFCGICLARLKGAMITIHLQDRLVAPQRILPSNGYFKSLGTHSSNIFIRNGER